MKALTIMMILLVCSKSMALSLSQLRPDQDISGIKPVKQSAGEAKIIELTENDKLQIAKKLNMRHALEEVTYQTPNAHRSQFKPLMSPAFTTGQGASRN